VSIAHQDTVLAYMLKEAPPGMSVSATGVITWMPRIWQTGTHTVVLGVTAHEGDGAADSADQRFSIRVAAALQCPAVLLLDNNEEELMLLRRFRDRQLIRSATGLTLTALYYLHASEITAMLSADAELFKSSRQCLRELLPVLAQHRAADKKIELTEKQRQQVLSVLHALRAAASPALRVSLRYAIKEVENSRP
jgi:hypothetical protein